MPIQASEPVAERPAADTGWRVPAARAREQWLSDPRRTHATSRVDRLGRDAKEHCEAEG